MRTIRLKIQAGPNTCSERKGIWCHFLVQSMTGWDPTCRLFGKPLRDRDGDVTGWLERLPECKEAERG